MQDDDDELDGLSPTSMWRRTRRKDPFEDEDEEEEEQKEEEDDDEEEEEEDHKHITNAGDKGKLHPPPIPLAVVRVVSPPKNLRRRAGMSTGGKAPRSCVASRNLAANFCRREKSKESGSTPEWKPSKEKIEEKLWKDLAKSSRKFKQAYDLMMALLQNLQDLQDPKEPENKKKK